MAKDELLNMKGTVIVVLPNSNFRVKLEQNDNVILAYISGKLRQNKIKILEGDRVELEISPYDLSRGRIVYRLD